MVRVEMLNHDARDAGSGRKSTEQFDDGLEATGRCADADHVERHLLDTSFGRV